MYLRLMNNKNVYMYAWLYVKKFVSDRLVVFSGTLVFSTNKTDCHNMTEILLKVVLNTITPTH
jgi:hypothetical protein